MVRSPPWRLCPVCEKNRLCGVEEARAVFRTSRWGSDRLLDKADVVCSFCHAVRINGQWERLEAPGQRAWRLAEGSSTKSADDYRDVLKRGIDA